MYILVLGTILPIVFGLLLITAQIHFLKPQKLIDFNKKIMKLFNKYYNETLFQVTGCLHYEIFAHRVNLYCILRLSQK